MNMHALIDRLDVLRQRLDARTATVPAKGDPPPAMARPEGPPRHSTEGPSIFCETGACLPLVQNSANLKSDFSEMRCRHCGEPYPRDGADLIMRCECRTMDGEVDAGWPAERRRLEAIAALSKTVGSWAEAERQIDACLPGTENSGNGNPTVSCRGTDCPVCGMSVGAEEDHYCAGRLRVRRGLLCEPTTLWVSANFSDQKSNPSHLRYLASDGHEAVRYENLAGEKYMHVPTSRLNAVMTAEESERAWFGTVEQWEAGKKALSEQSSASNQHGLLPLPLRQPPSYYSQLQAIAAQMSTEYRRTVEGPDVVDGLADPGRYERMKRLVSGPKLLAMATVAGHTFEGVGSDARCGCGKYRVDLRHVDRSSIGTHGHAHVGELTEHEYNQIEEMWAREEAIWEAVEGVAGGR